MLSPVTLRQFERLQAKFPGATLDELPSGAALATIPRFAVPEGWSADHTEVRFIVPAGYPGPSPDCFWASGGLRLKNGQLPHAAQDPHHIPETQMTGLWFSWHVVEAQSNWNPNRDDLLTYVSIIADRFKRAV